MTFWKWSQTAASNATADSTINWAEGQAPSSINDSARAVMAAAAKYRDDIAGAIVTGGTSTAYTVTSYQVFDTLAHLNGQMIGFSPHATNADTVTLNVDGLGAKPLRSAPSVELVAGTLVQGTPYVAVYNSSDSVFYLRGYYYSPYNIPFLGGLDYWDTVTPNSSFIFPAGQAISRTVYSRAFVRWGTSFGIGDGSTTFNVPDKRGRVSAAIDDLGGSAAGRLTSGTFAAAFGEQSHLLTVGEIPAHTHSGTTGAMSANASHSHSTPVQSDPTTYAPNAGAHSGAQAGGTTGSTNTDHTHSFTTDSGTGGGSVHNNVQPTIACCYILRII